VLVAIVSVPLAGCTPTRPFWIDKVSAYLGLSPPFLGPADFQGQYVPQPAATLNGLQSTYSGTVAVTMVDREVVKQMLPPGLFLAPPKSTSWTAGRHPVVHMVGDQLQPSTLLLGIATQVGPGYKEMIMVIPFVVRGTGTDWHNYAVRMYLDSQIAVDGGNQLFGYAKVLAQLEQAPMPAKVHHKIVSPDLATTWFLDDIDEPVEWLQMIDVIGKLPRWNDIREILAMPFLGVRPTDQICSYWELEFANASLGATVSRHRVVTKFRPGMEAWENMGDLWSAPDGAVSMRNVRWRLALPPRAC
jgi:hypothetical protein